LGPVLVLFFFLSKLFLEGSRKSLFSFSLFLSTIIATLVNPFFWRVWVEVLRHATRGLENSIAEWVPTIFPHSLFVIIFAVVISLFYTVKYLKSHKTSAFEILTIIFFAILALKARRNLPIFYLSIIALFPMDLPKLNRILEHPQIKITTCSIIVFLIVLSTPGNIYKVVNFSTNWGVYCETGYVRLPCKATEFAKDFRGNIFNMYEWGGFLDWKIPNSKVFIDGRMPAWQSEKGKNSYRAWLEILQAQDSWNTKLEVLQNQLYIRQHWNIY